MQNSGELYDAFRSDVADEVEPYLWSDPNIYTYMNDAYKTFARLTGGIADSSSSVTQIPVVASVATATVSPLILKFRQAFLTSTGEEIDIINEQDAGLISSSDYGQIRKLVRDSREGAVRYMMIGLERSQAGGTVRWVQVPAVDDMVELVVYRLPSEIIRVGDRNFEFSEIGQEHIEFLKLRMKALAYDKQDAETRNQADSKMYDNEFTAYCVKVKNEWERYKHKTREIAYGGL